MTPDRPKRPALGLALAAGLALGLAAGCARAPAVTSNVIIGPDEPARWDELTPRGEWRELTPAEQSAALSAMHELAAGQSPRNPPGPAPGPRKVRWSDVETAAAAALAEIEAIFTRKDLDGATPAWRFEIVTVEDWPGELIVRRVEGPEVYEADATIGRFPLRDEHRRRAKKLLEAFDVQMKKLGRMAWFNDEDLSG
jgi:hypothetical protein